MFEMPSHVPEAVVGFQRVKKYRIIQCKIHIKWHTHSLGFDAFFNPKPFGQPLMRIGGYRANHHQGLPAIIQQKGKGLKDILYEISTACRPAQLLPSS